jgi:hypothetical protein
MIRIASASLVEREILVDECSDRARVDGAIAIEVAVDPPRGLARCNVALCPPGAPLKRLQLPQHVDRSAATSTFDLDTRDRRGACARQQVVDGLLQRFRGRRGAAHGDDCEQRATWQAGLAACSA